MKKVMAALMMAYASTAEAQDPYELGRRDPALLLGQALVAEAGWRFHADHLAIPWVISRRATLPAFRRASNPEVAALIAYVSALKCADPARRCDSERRRRMRSITWGMLDSLAPKIARVARDWFGGRRHPDPCPDAWHWGSGLRRSSQLVVQCGHTTNTFLGRPVYP
jgi:hypothetical protein